MAEIKDPITISKSTLVRFEPVARLSPSRLEELAAVCYVETVSKNLDPTRMMHNGMQALYVVTGDLGIRYENGNKVILRAGTDAAKHPVDADKLKIKVYCINADGDCAHRFRSAGYYADVGSTFWLSTCATARNQSC